MSANSSSSAPCSENMPFALFTGKGARGENWYLKMFFEAAAPDVVLVL